MKKKRKILAFLKHLPAQVLGPPNLNPSQLFALALTVEKDNRYAAKKRDLLADRITPKPCFDGSYPWFNVEEESFSYSDFAGAIGMPRMQTLVDNYENLSGGRGSLAALREGNPETHHFLRRRNWKSMTVEKLQNVSLLAER